MSALLLLMAIVFCSVSNAVADDTPRHMRVGGLDIYIGILPSEMVSSSTTVVHNSSPSEHSFHLAVALFDADSGNRITDAEVAASLTGRSVTESKVLDQMPVAHAPVYGNFFTLLDPGKFTLELAISQADRSEPVAAGFELEFVDTNSDDELLKSSTFNRASSYDYGIWSFVIINSAIILIFAFSFYHPKTKRDWRTFGAFSAFVIALFTEMYGFPLTIYLLSGWLTSNFPDVDIFSHHAGHLWWVIFGGEADPHSDPFHILSNVLIIGGLILLAMAWRVLHKAQKQEKVANRGIYARIRHPQYVGFIIIMTGFLLQWPTLPTLVMFPVLVWMYVRLARREEQESIRLFGDGYREYMKTVPGFIPGLPEKGA